MNKQLEEEREREIIAKSAYFDAKWYAEKYHISQENSAAHYLNEGWKLGFDPSEQFSTSEYLRRRCDIVASGINPLLHYETQGKAFWDRFKRITTKCDLDGFGLEIGPYMYPVCPKSRGYNVEILDYADQDTLRRLGEQHPNPDTRRKVKRIEAVDYIWAGEDYRDLIGKTECYDYIVASHVIEHTTDLVGFLEQCAALLKENGILSLVIPDKRYCFDFFRETSSLSKVIDKCMEKDKSKHSRGTIMEVYANEVRGDNQSVLKGTSQHQLKDIQLCPIDHEQLQSDLRKTEYADMHEWVFTPASFRILINDLQEFGMIQDLREVDFYPTAKGSFEFFISFRKTTMQSLIDVSARLERRTALRHERLQENIDFYTSMKLC